MYLLYFELSLFLMSEIAPWLSMSREVAVQERWLMEEKSPLSHEL